MRKDDNGVQTKGDFREGDIQVGEVAAACSLLWRAREWIEECWKAQCSAGAFLRNRGRQLGLGDGYAASTLSHAKDGEDLTRYLEHESKT